MVTRTIVLACATLALAAPAHAQSFGRNKVRYADFDFQVLETPHFDIYHYPAEHEASVLAGRLAERWYARLSRRLDYQFTARQPIVLYGSHAAFTQTNVIPEFLGDGIGGVTEHERGRIVLPFAIGFAETDHVLGHELAHVFQREILRSRGRSIATLPLWFIEGMAEFLSVGRPDATTRMWLSDAVRQNQLPALDQLADPRWSPYRFGHALWAYLAERFGDDFVATCLTSRASGGALGRLAAASGVDVRTLSAGWHESIRSLVAGRAGDAPPVSRTPVTLQSGNSRMQVGPALSPDGESLVLLAERDQSIDLVLADAATGTVRRRLIETAADRHFESVQFIESAGAWDATGRRFVLAARARGTAVLTILDPHTGTIEREVPVRDVDQAFSPAWSPDGRLIAFAGLRNGFSDLYVMDLQTDSVRALTRDPFADLQPAWSPDGRTIAFSTDRFSSSLDTLTFGDFRLGAIDVATGAMRALPGVPGAKNIDPHWTADGARLYFIADRDGVSNVYETALADGRVRQITDVATGVSGVTRLSPALTAAAHGHRLAFTVYEGGRYVTQTLDDDASGFDATAVAIRAQEQAEPAAVFGAPDGNSFAIRPYRAGLSLNRTVHPYLSAGGGAAGSFLRAGIGVTFGDMLGDQQLSTALQVGTSVDDFVVQAAYVNRRSRWNWGLAGGQIPWVTAAAAPVGAVANGAGTLSRQSALFRQQHRMVEGLAQYPLSAATRLELTGSLERITFAREMTTSVYSAATGQLLTEASVTDRPSTATLMESGAALVHDTALHGATSPIAGGRSRVAVAATAGSLTFTTVTADYRRYIMPVRPVTIAVRAMHLGRYGESSADPRLLPLVWSLRDVVRGYGDVGPVAGPGGALSAGRMLVGNVEIRFPLAALVDHHASPGRPFEGLLFLDAGRFWTPSAGEEATRLRSAGAGVRLNAAGLVLELSAARPFDRDSPGWTFAFNYRPGF